MRRVAQHDGWRQVWWLSQKGGRKKTNCLESVFVSTLVSSQRTNHLHDVLIKKKGPKNMFFKSQDYLQPSSSRACRPSRRRWACFFFICFIVWPAAVFRCSIQLRSVGLLIPRSFVRRLAGPFFLTPLTTSKPRDVENAWHQLHGTSPKGKEYNCRIKPFIRISWSKN